MHSALPSDANRFALPRSRISRACSRAHPCAFVLSMHLTCGSENLKVLDCLLTALRAVVECCSLIASEPYGRIPSYPSLYFSDCSPVAPAPANSTQELSHLGSFVCSCSVTTLCVCMLVTQRAHLFAVIFVLLRGDARYHPIPQRNCGVLLSARGVVMPLYSTARSLA